MRAALFLSPLLVVAACSEPARERSIADNAAMLEQALEEQADNMAALADTTANADAAAAIDEASANLEAAADDVGDAAEDAAEAR